MICQKIQYFFDDMIRYDISILKRTRYQDFNFDTISIQYLTKYCDVDIVIDIFRKISM